MSKKKYQKLIDERDYVRDAITRAFTRNDKEEENRLKGHLEWLDRKIKRLGKKLKENK